MPGRSWFTTGRWWVPLARRQPPARGVNRQCLWRCVYVLMVCVAITAAIPLLVHGLLTHEDGEPIFRHPPSSPNGMTQSALHNARVVCVCHPKWHGIRAATYTRGVPVIEVSDMDTRRMASTLLHDFQQLGSLRLIVIEGIIPGSVNFAYKLRQDNPNIKIAFIYHGAPSNIPHEEEASLLENVLRAIDDNTVNAVGFVKFGLADAFRAIGVPAFTLWNSPALPNTIPASKFRFVDNKTHIGVLGKETIAKNVLTQLIALCALEDTVVHVISLPAVPYLKRCRVQFVEHGFMTHSSFVSLVASLDVNLYISLSECFPMVVLESISNGVPCLVSPTTSIYSRDEVLQRLLVVNEFDNPAAILTQVMVVLQEKQSLSFRCKGLVQWLYQKAAFEWDDFTNSLVKDQQPVSVRSVTQGPEYSPWVYSTDHPVTAHPPQSGLSIAIMTYELSPHTAGGAGVVISALIVEMLARGYRVIVVGYLGKATLNAWCDFARGDNASAAKSTSLVCVDVPTLLSERNVQVEAHPNIFVSRSREVALAVREVYATERFDVLELFDYAGIGFELLHRRHSNSTSARNSATPYLPPEVPIIVRLHGTLELISVAESLPTTSEQHTMFLMEQFCLETADFLFAQSNAMRTFYSSVYSLNPSRIVVAAPPMAQILSPITAQNLGSDIVASGLDAPIVTHVLRVKRSCQRTNNCIVILAPGKLQKLKGTHTILEAMERINSLFMRTNKTAHLVFFGQVNDCPEHNVPLSNCVRNSAKSSVSTTVLPPIPRTAYPWLIEQLDPAAAIVASKFETFNLAVHEMIAMGLTVVASDIPAFRELPQSVLQRFNANDPLQLADAVVTATLSNKPRASRKLQYPDPMQPYGIVTANVKRGPYEAVSLPLLTDALKIAISDAL